MTTRAQNKHRNLINELRAQFEGMAKHIKKTEKAGKSMDLKQAYDGAVEYLQKNCPEYLESVSKTDTMSNPRYAALLADIYANTA